MARGSEEHTSELQSLRHLVCRLLLEKKKKKKPNIQRHDVRHKLRQEGRSPLSCTASHFCCSYLFRLPLSFSFFYFFFFFFLMIRRPPRSPLFPYPPLFR